jgi:AAA domain
MKATRLDIFEVLAKTSPEARQQVNRKAYAEQFGETLEQFETDFEKYLADKAAAVPVVVPWRTKFHTGEELAQGDVKVYVTGILPEGVTFIGSLPGIGKSWFALSLARALTTGEPFLKVFPVTEICPVVYLVPEMSDRAVRKRIEKLKMPMKGTFYTQTISDGVCRLGDLVLKACIEELKPVIFLDTAIRFSEAESENSASDTARSISAAVIRFRQWGARAVVCLHHSPKFSAKEDMMTAENVLRGSGDLSAVCDAVWGLRHDRKETPRHKPDLEYLMESMRTTRVFCACVKERDFQATRPFVITGRPYIDTKGDFAVLTSQDSRSIAERVLEVIESDPNVSTKTLRTRFDIGFDRVIAIAKENSWMQSEGVWVRSVAPTVSEDNEDRKIPF